LRSVREWPKARPGTQRGEPPHETYREDRQEDAKMLRANYRVILAVGVVVSPACGTEPGGRVPGVKQALTPMAPPPVRLALLICSEVHAVVPAARPVVSACRRGWAPSRRLKSGEE
jgi:hypothetical protein